MKYIIHGLWILLLTAAVFGLVAGETQTILNVDDCDSLYIQVQGKYQIIPGEYSLLGCLNLNGSSWECICDGGYNLQLKTLPNTYNNYTFNITRYYSYYTSNSGGSSNSNSGSSGRTIKNFSLSVSNHYPYNDSNDTNMTSTPTTIATTTTSISTTTTLKLINNSDNQIININKTNLETTTPQSNKFKTISLIGAGIICFLLAMFMFFIFMRGRE